MSTSQAQMNSQYRYAKKKLHRVPLDLMKEEYDRVKNAADSVGESVNGYIKKAIRDRLESGK